MADQFLNGHALIVGVGGDLATTVDDAEGIAAMLRDPERCAYPPEQVSLLPGEQATRDNILTALDALVERADEDATVVVYFSGHGYQVRTSFGAHYFLMPHGYDLERLPDTAIRGDELADRIRRIRAHTRKVLLLLDCCHAGGLDPIKAPAEQWAKAPMPAEAQRLLKEGRGLVLVASSRANEWSFAGRPYSAFTLALIEALAGKGVADEEGYVRVADLFARTRQMVPARTRDRQHPTFDFDNADNFRVAYYAAGDTAPKGLPFEGEPEIEAEPGDFDRAMLDQRGQTVHGPQTNIVGSTFQGPVFTGPVSEGVVVGDQHTDSGGGVIVGGRVDTGGGKFVGRDDNTTIDRSTHYHGESPPIEPDRAEAIYRERIADRCRDLPLQSVDTTPDGGETEALRLAQVYIGLDTRRSASVTSIDQALARAAREKPERWSELLEAQSAPDRDEETRPVSALEAAILNRRLVLTGEPGSGKSTFLDHLTHALASKRWDCLSAWPDRERNALPVPVTLRQFARWIASRQRDRAGKLPEGNVKLLSDYIVEDLESKGLGLAARLVEKALVDGQAIVLLDGLDEVAADEEGLLDVVKESVLRFVECYRRCRHIVTCRVLSYQEPLWRLPANVFPDVELARFDEDKVDAFIGAWYREVGERWKGRLSADEIGTLAGKLRRAVRRPELWRLAPNPLLLTVMALVHSRRRELPEKRALLYEEAVEVLLQKREQDKTLSAPPVGDLLAQADRDFNDLKGVLEQLAFETHGSAPLRDEEDGAPIETLTLLERMAKLHPDESLDWAKRLLEALRLRASLLLERTDKVYSFPHRTFQEYLAGVYLARLGGDEFTRRASELSRDQPTYWREVVLLAVGYLVHKQREVAKPRLLLEELCPESAAEPDWRQIWLAGDVLVEVGVNRVRDTQHGRCLLERVRRRLVQLVERGELAARERAEAGDVLGILGDPRFDSAYFHLPRLYREMAEPLAGFVEIAPGEFVMGSPEGDPDDLIENEAGNPASVRIDYRYWIGRYPVIVAQFADFVAAQGYENECWWTETGWAWRRGNWDSQVENQRLRVWLQARPAEQRGAPMWWEGQQRFSNRPVVGVSWFEAMAYGAWLSEVLKESGSMAVLGDERYTLRLPTEAEWEKAARCDDGRRYPWGDAEWDAEHANTSDSEIGHPTVVGLYPQGASPGGLHDAVGNVWEWTLSVYRGYPYTPADGRNNPAADGGRVLRGGSWHFNRWFARCAVRRRDLPVNFYLTHGGFRVVLSLADSGF